LGSFSKSLILTAFEMLALSFNEVDPKLRRLAAVGKLPLSSVTCPMRRLLSLFESFSVIPASYPILVLADIPNYLLRHNLVEKFLL
jgi:hypothetical protein